MIVFSKDKFIEYKLGKNESYEDVIDTWPTWLDGLKCYPCDEFPGIYVVHGYLVAKEWCVDIDEVR